MRKVSLGPGDFHILINQSYRTRKVRCFETGRYHRHQWHLEEFGDSACGIELVKGRHQFAGLTMAMPSVEQPWCSKCVESIPWTAEATKEWEQRGYFGSGANKQQDSMNES